ncbi:MAG: hypothetical protein DRP89_07185, partial [Candidatus Neomarinimicrobiota bacterium]
IFVCFNIRWIFGNMFFQEGKSMKVLIRTFVSITLFIFIWSNMLFAENNITGQIDSISSNKLSISQARKLLLKSIILPGWGEHSLDYHRRGYGFNSSELIFWITYAAFQFHAGSMNDNMRAYAAQHAGVNPANKDDYYFKDIGNYMNIYEYNEQKLRYRQNSALYPDTDEYFWAWDSEQSRKEFDKIRIKGSVALRNASFTVAGLVVNRIISIFDIIALTRNRIEKPNSDLSAYVVPHSKGVTLSLNFSF